jgi:hypothetical protein
MNKSALIYGAFGSRIQRTLIATNNKFGTNSAFRTVPAAPRPSSSSSIKPDRICPHGLVLQFLGWSFEPTFPNILRVLDTAAVRRTRLWDGVFIMPVELILNPSVINDPTNQHEMLMLTPQQRIKLRLPASVYS